MKKARNVITIIIMCLFYLILTTSLAVEVSQPSSSENRVESLVDEKDEIDLNLESSFYDENIIGPKLKEAKTDRLKLEPSDPTIPGKGDRILPQKYGNDLILRRNAVILNAENFDALTIPDRFLFKNPGGLAGFGETEPSRILSKWDHKNSNYEYFFSFVDEYDQIASSPTGFAYSKQLKNGFDVVYIRVMEATRVPSADWKEVSRGVFPVRVFTETPSFQRVSTDSDVNDYAIKIISKSQGEIPYLTSKDMLRQDKESVELQLANDLEFEVWDMATAKKVDQDTVPQAKVTFEGTTLPYGNLDNFRGGFSLKLSIGGKSVVMENSIPVLQQNIIDEYGELTEYQQVDFGNTVDTLVNPINKSTAGMINRGLVGYDNTVIGYAVRDYKGQVPLFGIDTYDANMYQQPVFIGADRRQLYFDTFLSNPNYRDKMVYESGSIVNRSQIILEKGVVNQLFPIRESNRQVYFLKHKNEDKLLQIMIDKDHGITYTYSVQLMKNLNFRFDLKMYNNKVGASREFNLGESFIGLYGKSQNINSTNTLESHRVMSVQSLGNHDGYTAKAVDPLTREPVEFATRWKKNDIYMSDINKYTVLQGDLRKSGGPGGGIVLFGDTVSEPGLEAKQALPKGQAYFPDDLNKAERDKHYEVAGFSTGWQPVPFDEYLHSGFEQFVGEEIEYLNLKTNPPGEDIYEDQWIKNKTIDATVDWSGIMSDQNKVLEGRIEYLYYDGTVRTEKWSRNVNKPSAKVLHEINSDYFPEELNNQPGTIKNYPIEMVAVNTTDSGLKDLSSEESYYNLNVYNLGATPKLQMLAKGSKSFNKKPIEIIEDITILPKNKDKLEVVYWYDNKEIKNISSPSDIGIETSIGDTVEYAEVKVKDNSVEDKREVIVRVPFYIYDGGSPSGLVITADNIFVDPDEIKNLSDNEIDKLVLERSNAFGADASSGSSDGVNLSIDPNKRLPYDAKEGETYKVDIIADKQGSVSKRKEIEVFVGKSIEATPVSQKIPIGNQEINYMDFVKDVKVSGVEVDPNSGIYDVELAKNQKIPDVITKNTKVKVNVYLVGNKQFYVEKEIPIETYWGNTISFGGDDEGGRMGGGAYALHNSENEPYISAVSGAILSDDNLEVSKNNKENYLGIGVFDLSNTTDIFKVAPTDQPSGLTAKGIDKKQDVLDQWGSNRVKKINYGDVVKAWSLEPQKHYLTNDSNQTPSSLNDKQADIFYEITTDGYRRLQFNRIKPFTEQLAMYGTSEGELDKRAKNGEFIELSTLEPGENKQAFIKGFKEGHYPDTSVPNKTVDSIIIVEEKLTSGKIINYEVPVKFVITDGALSFQSADDVVFGKRNMPSSDVYIIPDNEKNTVVLNDNRYEPKEWDLHATMEKPLHYVEGTTVEELKDSSMLILGPSGDKVLSDEAVVIHKTTSAEAHNGENEISWNNRVNEGYRLFVKNGTAKKNKKYSTTIVYSINDKPTTKGVGKD